MKCFLKSVKPGFPSIELLDKIKLCIGRTRATQVQDSKVSRIQIEATANFSKKSVTVKQVGPNNSGVNGEPIQMGLDVTATEGDTVNLIVSSDFDYKVSFEEDTELLLKTDDSAKPQKIPRMFGQKSVADEFRKDILLPKGNWENIQGNDLLIYAAGSNIMDPKPNIGAFDLDGTIITTKSGKVFPKDENDWKFRKSDTLSKLQSFFFQNPSFKFVIFSNQNGLKQAKDVPPFQRKIQNIIRQIGIPVLVFLATKKDKFRKPMTGSWDIYVSKFNEGVEPDRSSSFYCGDAAGRKGDHSKGDLLFALNLGLKFHTPEEYFNEGKGSGGEYGMPAFNPAEFVKNSKDTTPNGHIQFPDKPEMIIMVGYPGSGKSTFVKSVLVPKGYDQINRDTLKTMPKCISAAGLALAAGKKVVIDNTNPVRKDREEFIQLAKKHKVPVRCFKMDVSFNQCLHNNKYRFIVGDLPNAIPEVAFNSFKSRYIEPTLDEGYSEIVQVQFVPQFGDESREKLYAQYLLEK